MAQIITLKDAKDRHMPSSDTRHMDGFLGPAQVLFFTGVRYERYENATPKQRRNYTAKQSNKRSTTH